MKVVVQRVSSAQVETSGKIVGQIGRGLMLLVGFGREDADEVVIEMAKKIGRLRVMSDEDDKMNLSIKEINGEILAVSQFTLYGNTRKGNRPSFVEAAEPSAAKKWFELFVDELKKLGVKVEMGSFGNYMEVSLVNDGPVTILLEE